MRANCRFISQWKDEMARYYFDTLDGIAFEDREGTELPTLDAAFIEALRILCQITPDRADDLRRGGGLEVRVFDPERLLLITAEICVTFAPTVSHPRSQ